MLSIVLCMVVLAGEPASAQSTLRTPGTDGGPCVDNDCGVGTSSDGSPGTRSGNGTGGSAQNGGSANDGDNGGANYYSNYPYPNYADPNCESGACYGPYRRRKPGAQNSRPLAAGQRNNDSDGDFDGSGDGARRGSGADRDRKPEPPTEFQEFVSNSLGRPLPIYGHSLFDQVPTTFAPVERVPVTDDYTVGPGDEILLRAWGQIDMDGKLVVDRGGEVFLPKVGALTVAGLRYQQLPDYFRTAIGRVFRNFDLTVNLGQLRSIQVFVVGQARRPGSYTVSSLSTLVNTLFASGGPSSTGSMRHIQLKRNNRVVTEFDFYDLLLRGDKSKDTRLLPGDVIYIPPAGPAIAISGSVNLPAIYELKEGTTLEAAVEMAGGMATTADGKKAVVERIDGHNTRRVEEFPLDGAGMERELKDGDVVRIFALSPHFANAVTLRGNVAHPGRVEWHRGLRLRDVIPNQEALITRDYWRSANAVGEAAERTSQAPTVSGLAGSAGYAGYSAARYTSASEARSSIWSDGERDGNGGSGTGAERRDAASGWQTTSARAATEATTARLRKQIARNAPEINWDYALIQRLNPQDLSTRLIPFDLGKLILHGDEADNLALEPGDVITIFSQSDLAVPLAKQTKFVRLEGEFRTAGVYQAEPGETIRHLVERAGGLTPSAYLYGAEFIRESARVEQQKGLDQLVEHLEQEISRNAMVPSGVNPDEVADARARQEAQRQLVQKLRAIPATGRVVLDLKPGASVNDLPEIALEDGDRLVIPYRPSTVETLGAVYNRTSFLFRPEGRVDDYLKRAGGPTRSADKGRMFVIRADGSVLSKQSVKGMWNGGFDSLRLMPGDAVVVPERLSQGSVLKSLRDWSQVFAQFALGAAAVKVLQ